MPIIDPFDEPKRKSGAASSPIFDPYSTPSGPRKEYEGIDIANRERPSPTYIDPTQEMAKEVEGYGPLKKFLIGTGEGIYEAGRGLQQGYYGLTGQKEKLADVTAQGTMERETLNPLGGWGRAGSVVGQSLPYTLLPGGVAGGVLRRAGTSALAGAAQGGLSFVPEGGSRTINTLTGAAGGAGGSLLMSGLGKTWNALTGPRMSTNKWNIPTTLAEQTKGVSSRGDVLLERSPGVFGTKAFRARQHDAAHSAAKDFLTRYIANPLDPSIEGGRAFVSNLYQDFNKVLKSLPNTEMRPIETYKTAKTLMDQYPEVFEKLQDQKSKKIIQNILKDTSPEFGTVPPVVKDTTGGLFPPTQPAAGKSGIIYHSFEDMWMLRQALGENLGFAKKELNHSNYSKYKDLWLSVTRDMEKWAESIGRPDVMTKFKGANDAYKQFVVKRNVVQQAYDKAVNELGENIYFSPQKFANGLKRIIDKDKTAGTFAKGEISEMTGLANIMQVVKRAGQYMENPPTGNRWGALTLGGMAEAVMFKAGGVGGMIKGTMMAGLTAGAMKFLTTTYAGKKLMLAASKVEPDSPAMRLIVNSIYRQAPKFMAGATQDVAKPNERPFEGRPDLVEDPMPTPDVHPTSFDDWARQEYVGGNR